MTTQQYEAMAEQARQNYERIYAQIEKAEQSGTLAAALRRALASCPHSARRAVLHRLDAVLAEQQ